MARPRALVGPVKSPKPPKVIRSYKSALEFLFSVTNYERMVNVRYDGRSYNLRRMQRLLTALKNPHRGLAAVHIAGTKGKGSTAAMLAGMLQGCGYKVGLYTSPHVVDIRERIQINGNLIPEAVFARLMGQIASVVSKVDSNGPTFFEIMTALALLYFARERVDLAILEVGMGGRLDCTNVVRPKVCGITRIGLDHISQLGGTLAEIAAEKAGIFKKGVPAISVEQVPEVKKALKKVANAVGTPLRFTGDDIEFSYRFESSRTDGPHTRVCLVTATSQYEHLHVPLPGEHQAVNCGLALALLDELKSRGLQIDDAKAVAGLAKVSLPGRMELVSEDPRVLIDGAHNADSIRALMVAVGQSVPYDSMVLIFGCSVDKDIDGMLANLTHGADKVIFTRSRSPRSADPEQLMKTYVERTGKMAQCSATLPEAIRIASSCASHGDLIVVTGSFYLAGEAKQHFQSGLL